MITVEKRPPLNAFAGNPLRYQVLSNSLYSNVGVKAYCELQFTAMDHTTGHHFTLSFMNMILDFAISDGNNESGQQIPKATLSDTISSWTAKVLMAIRENYYLYTYYDIVGSSTTILFTAKEKGSFYTMGFTNINVTTISQYHHMTGVDVQAYPGFGILAQVLDENNRVIGEDFRPVDSDGRARFDMSEYINAFLEGVSALIVPDTGDIIRSSIDGIKLYQVAFCEKYEGVTKRMFLDYGRRALKGGLSREALVYWNEGNPFWSSINNSQRFLTWCPSGKLTTARQVERLFYFNQSNVQLDLNYRVFFSDNTHQDVSLGTFLATPYSIIEIQSGYIDLGLGSVQPTKEVTGWKVWLENTGDTVSEIFEFSLDARYKEFDRQFFFRNSFGWYDAMRATGKVEPTLEYERTEGYTIVEDEENDFNAPDKDFSVLESQTFKASTGWVNKATQNWLRDFLLSREIYELVDEKVYAVKITSKKSSQQKDGDYNLSLDFEYCRSYKDLYFSLTPAAGGGQAPPPQHHRNYCDSYSPSYS